MILSDFKTLRIIKVQELIKKLNALDLRVGFIGGVTRDYILTNKISQDIDLELRPNIAKTIDMSTLAIELDGSINKEFNIITIDRDNVSIELGLPRVEIFRQNETGHKNFDHTFSFGYDKEFERRDFTLNAIMFEYFKDESRIIDPKGGLKDLEDKLLKACSNDFTKDPVRALRAYRFSISKGLQISKQLELMLEKMNVSDCSSFYIKAEAIKSEKPLSFLKKIGFIKDFSELTVYNSNEFSLTTILQRDISILNSQEVLKKLELSKKGLISYTHSADITEQYELFTKFVTGDFKVKEMEYLLSYLNIDHSGYELKMLEHIDFNPNLQSIDKVSRKKIYLQKLLEEIKR